MNYERDEWAAAVHDLTEMDRAATENDLWQAKGMYADDDEYEQRLRWMQG